MNLFRRLLGRQHHRPSTTASVDWPVELAQHDIDAIEAARPFTMTSPQRLAALTKAVGHIHRNRIAGDIVECGVWRGGSMMAAARTLVNLNATDRALHLFDTYEGMPPPTEPDRDHQGRAAEQLLARSARDKDIWAIASLDDVRRNLLSTGYPAERISFVKGKVENTIPAAAPERIALLRLDTDWYQSTRHELEHLYPRLGPGGVLIIDDYGHWQGARRAVDEYFANLVPTPLLNVIDQTGRIAVKPG